MSINFVQVITNKLSELFGLAGLGGHDNDEVVYISARQKLRQVFNERSQRRRTCKARYTPDLTSRRAVSLFPQPIEGLQKEQMQTTNVNFYKLLIQIEGNQCSGCLQITSQKNRSRSAILVYRGRVIGCSWGQRNVEKQSFGQEALEHALSDLASPDNQLVAYQLSEDIVLAAAALFHGQALSFDQSQGVKENAQNAILSIRSSEFPGTVVINRGAQEDICMVYIAQGKILGLHSIERGWLDGANLSNFFDALEAHDASVQASVLVARSSQDAYKIGLSLTGIGDRIRTTKFSKEHVESMRNTGARRIPGPRKVLKIAPRTKDRTPSVTHVPSPGQYTGFHAAPIPRQVRHSHSISP